MLERKSDAAKTRRTDGHPTDSKADKKKSKELSKKTRKQRRSAESEVKQSLEVKSSRRHRGPPSDEAKPPQLPEEALIAWKILQPRLDESGELKSEFIRPESELDTQVIPRQISSDFVSEQRTSSPGNSGEPSSPRLARQVPPKGALRIIRPGEPQGKRKSLPVTSPASIEKSRHLKRMYRDDLAMLQQNTRNLDAIQRMSGFIQSADATQLREARRESRKEYEQLSQRIDRTRRELTKLESQKLVVAGTLKELDEAIAKSPQEDFPDDKEWDVLDGPPESPGSPSRSTAEHRRVQTDKV